MLLLLWGDEARFATAVARRESTVLLLVLLLLLAPPQPLAELICSPFKADRIDKVSPGDRLFGGGDDDGGIIVGRIQ